jgi:hypothetical protein
VPADAKDDTIDKEEDFTRDDEEDRPVTEHVTAAPAPAAKTIGKRKPSQTACQSLASSDLPSARINKLICCCMYSQQKRMLVLQS